VDIVFMVAYRLEDPEITGTPVGQSWNPAT
jgi:hypothetical protein